MDYLVCVYAIFAVVLLRDSLCHPGADYRKIPVVYDDVSFQRRADNSTESVQKKKYVSKLHCDEWSTVQWSSDFHGCLIQKKYNDGGRDLNDIIDRILQHAESCVDISSKDCRPNGKSFEKIFGKVISQIKDYAEMYLAEIRNDRANIKDLDCIETKLSLHNYKECLTNATDSSNNEVDEFVPLPSSVKELEADLVPGLKCANKFNEGCSREAKSSLNRMVRKIFGVPQPQVEDFGDQEPEEKKEEPWAWYDYIIQPIISAWNWIKSWF